MVPVVSLRPGFLGILSSRLAMLADFPAYNQLQAGDEVAWAEAFRRLWPIACHAAQHPSLTLSREDVEDAASEALAQIVARVRSAPALYQPAEGRMELPLHRAFSAPPQSRPAANQFMAPAQTKVEENASQELAALTATIAYRRAASLARRKMARKRSPEAGAVYLDPFHASDPRQAPTMPIDNLSDTEMSDLTGLLAKALAGLDNETRRLLHEKIGQGKSYLELSRLYQKPLPTLAARVMRGLAKVRITLRETPGLMQQLLAFLR
ncbi:MAG TPA: hypothetical protein PK256_18740 [Verrucomicrobiota bacterium]|nr:hypothetical protein [Verrucomicrobiota bacterium]